MQQQMLPASSDWQQQQQQPLLSPSHGVLGNPQMMMQYEHGSMQSSGDHWCVDCGGDMCCCVGACVCPSLAYGYNHVLGMYPYNSEHYVMHGVLPCVTHGLADTLVMGVGQTCHAPLYALFPLGFLLRATHRQALFGPTAQTEGRPESLAESAIVELLCWGCSLAQVHSHLRKRIQSRSSPKLEGSSILGTLYVPSTENSMNRL